MSAWRRLFCMLALPAGTANAAPDFTPCRDFGGETARGQPIIQSIENRQRKHDRPLAYNPAPAN